MDLKQNLDPLAFEDTKFIKIEEDENIENVFVEDFKVIPKIEITNNECNIFEVTAVGPNVTMECEIVDNKEKKYHSSSKNKKRIMETGVTGDSDESNGDKDEVNGYLGMDSFRSCAVKHSSKALNTTLNDEYVVTSSDSESDGECSDFGSEYIPDDDEFDERGYLIPDCDNQEPRNAPGTTTPPAASHEPVSLFASKDGKAVPKQQNIVHLWHQLEGRNTVLDPPIWLGIIEPCAVTKSPVEYFRSFFSFDILDHIVKQSNLYAAQKISDKDLNLCVPEFEQFLGSLLAMSLVKLSSSRLYWKGKPHCPMISEAMSRNRWKQIKSNLHFNNNVNIVSYDDPTYDKLFKIRPLLNHLVGKFREIPKPQRMCIDNQCVPFKSMSSLTQQNLKNKPRKCGYKVHYLCGTDGVIHDFMIYADKIQPVANEPDLGANSNIVLQLCQFIPVGINHLLYFGKGFTSPPLLAHLATKKIFCLGTVPLNKLPGISFATDEELFRSGRGTHQEKSALVKDVEVRVVKWMDNRSVILMSTFASAEPITECKRFDRQSKSVTKIPCPRIVREYEQFMGRADLMGSLISLNRIHARSNKYYINLFFYFLDVAVVNSWLLYRQDCKDLKVHPIKALMLQEFKLLIAESLLLVGKIPVARKRGNSSSAIASEFEKKKKLSPSTKDIPGFEIRTDGYHHLPVVKTRGRCKNPSCKAAPVYFCNKCNVHLCISKEKNCFLEFHTT